MVTCREAAADIFLACPGRAAEGRQLHLEELFRQRVEKQMVFHEDSYPLTVVVIARQLHRLIYTVYSEDVRPSTGLIYTYCRFLEQLGGRMCGRLSIPLRILLV